MTDEKLQALLFPPISKRLEYKNLAEKMCKYLTRQLTDHPYKISNELKYYNIAGSWFKYVKITE